MCALFVKGRGMGGTTLGAVQAERVPKTRCRLLNQDLHLLPNSNPACLADRRRHGGSAVKICAERQRVLDAAGHVIVLGGPGSGKTTIAFKKALVRIETGMLLGQSVLFLSFSRAAVARIVQASRLELPRKDRALLDVQTFHSFFWDL